jgi:hypothetical protein
VFDPNADMPEQELNLLQFTACLVAQAGASSAQIVWSDTRRIAGTARGSHGRPDYFRTETYFCDSARLVDRPEDWSGRFDPRRNWNGSDVATLPNQIGKHPVLFPPLQVLHRHCGHFRAAESAAKQDGNHGVVPRAAEGNTVKRAEQSLALVGGQPVPEPYAVLLNPPLPFGYRRRDPD